MTELLGPRSRAWPVWSRGPGPETASDARTHTLTGNGSPAVASHRPTQLTTDESSLCAFLSCCCVLTAVAVALIPVDPRRQLVPIHGRAPTVSCDSYVAPSATLIGQVAATLHPPSAAAVGRLERRPLRPPPPPSVLGGDRRQGRGLVQHRPTRCVQRRPLLLFLSCGL